jgi:hypothetical protein
MVNRQHEAGFVLATLIFFLTALTVLIAVTVPVYQMQAKRIQEQELMFRGGEYIRAILKFRQKFGAWPPSIDALVETNGVRFLRKRYTDPITGKPFRILTVNADNTINGSVLSKPNNPFQSNNPFQQNNPFGTQTPNQSGQPSQPGQPAQSGQPQSGQPQLGQLQPFGGSGCSASLTQTGASSSTAQGQPAGGQQTAPSQSTTPSPSSQTPSQSSQASGGFPNQLPTANTTPIGQGIIGVASDSEQGSVMVYNNCHKYNQWEFIASPNIKFDSNGFPIVVMPTASSGPFGVGAGNAGTSAPASNPFGQPSTNTTQPNSPFGFGAPQSPQQTTPPRPPGQE